MRAYYLLLLLIPLVYLSSNVKAQNCSFINTVPQINGTYDSATFTCDFNTQITQPNCNANWNPLNATLNPFGLCYGDTGNNGSNPNDLVSQQYCQSIIYCANLVIYLNQGGYFEYALDHDNNFFINNPGVYQNVAPDTSVYNSYNDYLQVLNASTTPQYIGIQNFTYEGTIFYSNLINIYPLEAEAQAGNLRISGFFNFVNQNQNNFLNSTVILQSPNLQISGTAAESAFFSFLTLVAESAVPITWGYTPGQLKNTKQVAATIISYNVALINTTPVITPYVSSQYDLNGLVNVRYNYEGTFMTMNQFNENFDNYYAPQLSAYNFVTQTAPLLIVITILLFILSKLNGE